MSRGRIAQIIVHEADEPNVLAHLVDADALTGEDCAEVDFLPIEADAPARCDGGGWPIFASPYDISPSISRCLIAEIGARTGQMEWANAKELEIGSPF